MNNIHFFKRINTGKKFSRKLRINNKFPAIIYGKKMKEIPIFINNSEIININFKNFFEKKFKLINEKNEIFKVKIMDIQYHPYKTTKIYHIDFLFI
ncbi:50S ribosomal protein L25 [Enterobacteriaceae endosymbiont of Donacia versicolorea]|uniref:50S ribosomal protein L25 n=1 Tax=Enterobacteriaceae endosymbiont of Donacia versicolorea TaxID=2675788 RepID=UPI0014491E6A|nr:50S ribosomal protein L25 [Enterobacteriaceae endosymbiont of Donacia versicolorea]QJC31938.1 50S ribosomal protein L25 [Enterobacteriaceae endosymbiont of Donacia versicolorea]